MKKTISDISRLFSPLEIVIQLVFLFGVNFYVFYLISKDILSSAFIGFVGMVFFFFTRSISNRRLKVYQENLDNLMKYVNNMIFFLGTGENVFYSLEATKSTVNKEIKADIDKTIELLEKDAELNTDHFERHDFSTLNQFHHNLKVKDDQGGNTEELFGTIQDSMITELKKRDELYKKRRNFAWNVYIMLGMILLMAFILRFMVSNLWDIFLSYTVMSTIVLFVTYTFALLNLYFLQKKAEDVSVKL